MTFFSSNHPLKFHTLVKKYPLCPVCKHQFYVSNCNCNFVWIFVKTTKLLLLICPRFIFISDFVNNENANTLNISETLLTNVVSKKSHKENVLSSNSKRQKKFRLFIGNLSNTITKESLVKLLNEFEITCTNISLQRRFAFVDTPDQSSLNKAIQFLNGYRYQGTSIVVQEAVKNKHQLTNSNSSSKYSTIKNPKSKEPHSSGNCSRASSSQRVTRTKF